MLTQDSQRTATDDFQQIDRDQLSDSGDPIRHFILISISNMIEPIDFFFLEAVKHTHSLIVYFLRSNVTNEYREIEQVTIDAFSLFISIKL